jgi:hypothetical protein
MIQTIHQLALAHLSMVDPTPSGLFTPGASAGQVTQSVTTFTSRVRDFIAPIFLFIISAISVQFLLKKQLTKFLKFIGLAVAVAIFFYYPGIVEQLAKSIAGLFGSN